MSQVEKKYRVASFDEMHKNIKRLGAIRTIEVDSTHYYAQLDTDDTLKLVAWNGNFEIHQLSTKNGLHNLDQTIPVPSLKAGFRWFLDHGYKKLDILDMHNAEYAYQDGGLALYLVDRVINSVILGYDEDRLPAIEKAFGLESAEPISVPYNKYLAQLHLLRSIDISSQKSISLL